ncbi:MAG: hypothetical protein FWD44_06755, partial [Oscillospiraceae bacterium]|nr:hypothetical protein [Oscillospiraceae bacterium]
RFDKANRDERFIIFGEIADMLLEYEKSDFDNIAVFEILELARLNAVSWFSHWYDTRIDLLSTFKKEDNTDDYTHMLELFINALVELNDLTTLFSLERELLFSPSDIDAIYSKLDEAVLSTLSGLKELGIQTINDKDFRGEANEMTLELFDELFEDWKETHKDSEHLNTFDDMLQEAIVFGQAEHDKILEQERRSGSSGSSGGNSSGGSSSGGGGNSGGGGSQTYPMTFICSACEASTTRNLPAGSYRMSHSCDTDYWHNLRNTSGGGSSGGNTPPEPTRTFVQTCVCGVTITLVVPFGQGITETCSCGAVHWATYGYG